MKVTRFFQLTTSRRGRPTFWCEGTLEEILSTHDLTQRSTGELKRELSNVKLSTHDLTQRSTLRLERKKGFQKTFNSRPHAEVDGGISPLSENQNSFNSRPHAEVDALLFAFIISVIPFQLTTSRRGRRSPHHIYRMPCFFQLTTSRRGRRNQNAQQTQRRVLSTHDLTQRSTSIFHIFYAKFRSYFLYFSQKPL